MWCDVCDLELSEIELALCPCGALCCKLCRYQCSYCDNYICFLCFNNDNIIHCVSCNQILCMWCDNAGQDKCFLCESKK